MIDQPRIDALVPHPARLSPNHPQREEILAEHTRACIAGLAGYTDPATGFFTMTAQYHLDRGSCCNNGCRHCPYLALDGDDLP